MPLFVNIPRRSKRRQRLFVPCVGPDAPVEARDGFGVVVEHVRLCVEHSVERFAVAVEVGY